MEVVCALRVQSRSRLIANLALVERRRRRRRRPRQHGRHRGMRLLSTLFGLRFYVDPSNVLNVGVAAVGRSRRGVECCTCSGLFSDSQPLQPFFKLAACDITYGYATCRPLLMPTAPWN